MTLLKSTFILLTDQLSLEICGPIIAKKLAALFVTNYNDYVEIFNYWNNGGNLLLQIKDDVPKIFCGFPERIWYITSPSVKQTTIKHCLNIHTDIEMLQLILSHGIQLTAAGTICSEIFFPINNVDIIGKHINIDNHTPLVYLKTLNSTYQYRIKWLKEFLFKKKGRYIIHTHINEENGAEDCANELQNFKQFEIFLINKHTIPTDRLKILLHFSCTKNAILITSIFVNAIYPKHNGLILFDQYLDEDLLNNYWSYNQCSFPTYLLATLDTMEVKYREDVIMKINRMRYYINILKLGFISGISDIHFENKTLLNSDLQQMFSTPLTTIQFF